MAEKATAKPASLTKRRTRAKMDRALAALMHYMEMERESHENYVRMYRLVFGTDPDLDEISNNWPPSEVFVIEGD